MDRWICHCGRAVLSSAYPRSVPRTLSRKLSEGPGSEDSCFQMSYHCSAELALTGMHMETAEMESLVYGCRCGNKQRMILCGRTCAVKRMTVPRRGKAHHWLGNVTRKRPGVCVRVCANINAGSTTCIYVFYSETARKIRAA